MGGGGNFLEAHGAGMQFVPPHTDNWSHHGMMPITAPLSTYTPSPSPQTGYVLHSRIPRTDMCRKMRPTRKKTLMMRRRSTAQGTRAKCMCQLVIICALFRAGLHIPAQPCPALLNNAYAPHGGRRCRRGRGRGGGVVGKAPVATRWRHNDATKPLGLGASCHSLHAQQGVGRV